MAKVIIYSTPKALFDGIANILASHFSIEYWQVGEDQDLGETEYILAGCDYACSLDSCVKKFVFLYKNKQIPFSLIRPLCLKESLESFFGFYLSTFLEQPLGGVPKKIVEALKASRGYPGSSRFPVPRYRPLFKIIEAQREIAEKPTQIRNLLSVAKILRCSRPWLSSKFHEMSGVRFQTFLIKMRCCYALWQILSSEKQIKNIALEEGYKPLYFTQLFCLLFGKSPQSIRSAYPLFS